MANFNDLATELQIAIWQLVLPYRGMHWVEIEGLTHEASYVRDSIRITRDYGFGDNVPETLGEFRRMKKNEEHHERYLQKGDANDYSGPFFKQLFPVVPAVWGWSGPSDDDQHQLDAGHASHVAQEVAYTRRCRQLSTYTLVATLLSTCQLSREMAMKYIQQYHKHTWYVYRSMGALHRTRPLDIWEKQCRDVDDAEPGPSPLLWKLAAEIRDPLDLAVLRLHDSDGRATSTLRQGPWQFRSEALTHQLTFAWFDRVALEWHPRWAEPGPDGSEQFRAGNVAAILGLMSSRSHESTMLYWLVDGIPKPNWDRDYPSVVWSTFRYWNAKWRGKVHKFSSFDSDVKNRFLADCDLDLEFEANGRRYYIVFVAIPWHIYSDARQYVEKVAPGTSIEGPFLGGEDMWPEKLRAPARFAHERLIDDDLYSLCTHMCMSFVLSWEPI